VKRAVKVAGAGVFANWSAPRRPPSRAGCILFDVVLSGQELDAAARRVLGGEREVELRPCPSAFFRGVHVQPGIQVATDGAGRVLFNATLSALEDEGLFDLGAGHRVCCQVISWTQGTEPHTVDTVVVTVGGPAYWADPWGLGPQTGWDAAAWAAKDFLLDDGMHVCVVIEVRTGDFRRCDEDEDDDGP
jgi:hypothetical protein